MRRHLTTLVALLAMALPALADAPFLPNGKAPDHVVTMVVLAIQRKEDSSRTYTHHAGWTRIDELVGRQLSTRYFGHADAVLVEALNLKAWNELINQSEPTPAGAPGDYEIVIEGQGEPADGYTRIVRRHHPWTFRDERGPDGIRTVSARNEVSLFSMSITFRGQHGTHTLLVNKFTPAPPQVKTQASGPQGPKDLGRSETVLGEVCHWLDVHPGLMDAGLHECRTNDGVVLKETQFARGRVHNLIATRFTRRPVAPSEVLPPADMLVPRSWGLPD